MKTCSISACKRKHHALGFCVFHYSKDPEQKKKIAKTRSKHYHRTRGAIYKKYEKTLRGALMRKYRNMKSRTMGIQKQKAHLYLGKELLSKEAFYRWAMKSPVYKKLHKQWVNSNYDRRLCPTVDRIDPKKGYTIKNMQWITHSENSKKGALSRHYIGTDVVHEKLSCDNLRNGRQIKKSAV